MARQIINIGLAPDDGTGDPVRTAFDKANQNFAELYGNKLSVALYEDQKAAATTGGSSVVGVQTRTLNTEVSDADNIATLSANAITPIAGTYLIEASSPAYKVSFHHIELYDGTSVIKEGSSEHTFSSDAVTTRSFLSAIVTTAGSTAYSIRHYTSLAIATEGLGVQTGTGTNSIFTQLKLTRLGD